MMMMTMSMSMMMMMNVMIGCKHYDEYEHSLEQDVVDVAAAAQVRLGPNGAEEIFPIGPLSAFEQAGLDKMLPDLIAQGKKGVEFATKA